MWGAFDRTDSKKNFYFPLCPHSKTINESNPLNSHVTITRKKKYRFQNKTGINDIAIKTGINYAEFKDQHWLYRFQEKVGINDAKFTKNLA